MAKEEALSRHVDITDPTDDIAENEENCHGLDQKDSPVLMLLYGIQVLIFHVLGPVTACFLIYNSLCTGPGDEKLLAEMISTSIFMMGLATMVQVSVGLRLPVFQGSSYTFIPVVTAMMSTDQWKCPAVVSNPHANDTMMSASNYSYDKELWRPRVLEVNGALALASCVQVFIGCTGLISAIMSKIGPLTVAPTISLVGLTLMQDVTKLCGRHWGLALLTAGIFIIISVILDPYHVPLPWWNSERGFHLTKTNIFSRFTSLYYILIPWLLCWVLTLSNALPTDPQSLNYNMRTDTKLQILRNADWLFIPRPGFYGRMTISLGIFLGMTSATLSSIIESVGDYYATANFLLIPTPPRHAVNRAIISEGVSGILCASLGLCYSTTSISANAAFVAITKVYSRRTWVVASVLVMMGGLCGKFGAAFALMPVAIVGGCNLCLLGVLPGFALRVLSHCDISSTRNLTIYGLTLAIGLCVPYYMKDNPQSVNTGIIELDQALTLFLSTGIVLGGVVGFTLDNIIPGSLVERGVSDYLENMKRAESHTSTMYDLPWGTRWMGQHPFFSYIPFMPSFKPNVCNCFSRLRKRIQNMSFTRINC